MELWNAPLFYMNILKIKNQKSGGTLALFEKDSYLSVSQCVSVWKGKTNTGRSPKNCVKKKGEPPKKQSDILNQHQKLILLAQKKCKNSFNSDFFPVFTRCIPPINLPSGLKRNCEKKNDAFLYMFTWGFQLSCQICPEGFEWCHLFFWFQFSIFLNLRKFLTVLKT